MAQTVQVDFRKFDDSKHWQLTSRRLGAMVNAAPYRTEIYCDLTTVPEVPTSDRVTMVDLDLDVCRVRGDQPVLLLDEDEFASTANGTATRSSWSPLLPRRRGGC